MVILTVVSWTVAGILGFVLWALLQDRQKGGDFVPFAILVVAWLVGFIAFFGLLPVVVYILSHLRWVS